MSVKWGHLREINYRTRVGSDAWFAAHSTRLRKLSAFRYLHLLKQGHPPVRRRARKLGRDPSSSMSVKQMVNTARQWEAK